MHAHDGCLLRPSLPPSWRSNLWLSPATLGLSGPPVHSGPSTQRGEPGLYGRRVRPTPARGPASRRPERRCVASAWRVSEGACVRPHRLLRRQPRTPAGGEASMPACQGARVHGCMGACSASLWTEERRAGTWRSQRSARVGEGESFGPNQAAAAFSRPDRGAPINDSTRLAAGRGRG